MLTTVISDMVLRHSYKSPNPLVQKMVSLGAEALLTDAAKYGQ